MALGNKLDPTNPLYGGNGQGSIAAGAVLAAAVATESGLEMRNTVTLPGELAQLADEASQPEAQAVGAEILPNSSVALGSLDFDLGQPEELVSEPAALPVESVSTPAEMPSTASVEVNALDFDLASDPLTSDPSLDATMVRLDFSADNKSDVAGVSSAANIPDLDFDLGLEPKAPMAESGPQVTTDSIKALGVPSDEEGEDGGVEFDVSLTESTFLGRSVPGSNGFDMGSIDLDLDHAPLDTNELSSQPGVTPAGENNALRTPFSSPVAPHAAHTENELDSFERAQVSTAVNPDFALAQAETVVNPSFAAENDAFDPSQAETMLAPTFGAPEDDALGPDISPSEEVTTKLDLAKAYEEMGDLEGARELLQEVVKEGDATQREKAQALLTRIGE